MRGKGDYFKYEANAPFYHYCISKAYQQQENAPVSRIIDRCKSTKIANS